ncbi:MAG TPA: chromosomal replication initiator protein DnaA [Phycisphaerae bacterium]|nr:chromosomal replication initiator protein DnaA [Phycisphaerae bacterium]
MGTPFDAAGHARSVWNEIVEYIRNMHSPLVRQWFTELEPNELSSGVLTVRCSTSIQQQYLAIRCREVFNDAAQAVTGKLVSVNFICTSGANGNRVPNIYNDVILSPDYVFENFVVGSTNQLAYATCRAVIESPGRNYNPLFIHGSPGLGKTHLLQATCQEMLNRRPETRIVYVSCDNFINHFMTCVQAGGSLDQFRNIYRNAVDVLIIDDIHFLAGRNRTQDEFFHTFNALFQQGKQIILSSDSPPLEIPQIEERLVSRFGNGMVASVGKPCYETRFAIILKKAALRGINLPANVSELIATRFENNIRELEGAITKIQAYAMLNGGKYDLETANLALGDILGPSDRIVTIQQIIEAVTHFYSVKVSDLQGKRRPKSISMPRQICMYLARKRTRHSLQEIGGYFGGRDHTTVMHAIKTIEDYRKNDPSIARVLDQIEASLDNQAARNAVSNTPRNFSQA